MNWRFILFLIVLGAITFIVGYQFEILNYHQDDVPTWIFRIAVVGLCLFGIFVCIISFVANRKGLPVATTLFIIILSWIGALMAGGMINKNRSATTRLNADAIIRASYNYYADKQKFPESLKDLQPTYLKEIPMITLGATPTAFEYYSSKDHFSITYDDLKNKGMRYDSDKKTWEVLDRSFQ